MHSRSAICKRWYSSSITASVGGRENGSTCVPPPQKCLHKDKAGLFPPPLGALSTSFRRAKMKSSARPP
eukprot:4716178-Pleurochrysis_carterae.AAC.1